MTGVLGKGIVCSFIGVRCAMSRPILIVWIYGIYLAMCSQQRACQVLRTKCKKRKREERCVAGVGCQNHTFLQFLYQSQHIHASDQTLTRSSYLDKIHLGEMFSGSGSTPRRQKAQLVSSYGEKISDSDCIFVLHISLRVLKVRVKVVITWL